MSRYHVASLFFQRALHELSPSSANAKPEAESDGQLNHKFTGEILYNAGLSLLMACKPLEAFHAFESAASLYQLRPHYWIRLTECCIVYHSQQWDAAINSGMIAGAVASGRARRDRKSVVEGKSVAVRVALGGRRIIKKKKTQNDNA